MGCCPGCQEWNTLVEVVKTPLIQSSRQSDAAAIPLKTLSSVKPLVQPRIKSGIGEWDRVVGGGMVPGSLLVLTGDPGIGKSTLLLQICQALATHHTVFYFSTEESLEQVTQRAERLQPTTDNLLCTDEGDFGAILATIQKHRPHVAVIDSIQNASLQTEKAIPGTVHQLREATFQLMRVAKECQTTILVTSHITKEGVIAGPKTLEHMVDAVFYLQAEDRFQTRILRSVKNRFGTINEIGFFDMTPNGLQEIADINKQFVDQATVCPGSALISTMEGSRPLLIEIQALTIASKLSMPQRVISGLDHKQVILIVAILEKYLHIKLSTQDIFVKVSSGLKIKGNTADLGIAVSLLSSYFQQPLANKAIMLAEISLTGYINPINHIGILAKEAEKFGIKQIFVAKNQLLETSSCIITRFSHVYELLTLFESCK